MKTKKMILYYVLMFLPLAVTLIALQYLPEEIPAHYDFHHQVTRWGSKYESLIFPIIIVIFGIIMLVVTKFAAKQENSGESSRANNKTVCITAGILGLVLFNAMTFYFLYTSFQKVENLSSVRVDIYQIMMGLLGLFFVVMGNIMPKVRMNSVVGLRTTWSMKNEITWKKSQRFGGITFIVLGVAMIATCFLTKGISCFLISMGLLLVSMPIDIYYTYRVAKQQSSAES